MGEVDEDIKELWKAHHKMTSKQADIDKEIALARNDFGSHVTECTKLHQDNIIHRRETEERLKDAMSDITESFNKRVEELQGNIAVKSDIVAAFSELKTGGSQINIDFKDWKVWAFVAAVVWGPKTVIEFVGGIVAQGVTPQ